MFYEHHTQLDPPTHSRTSLNKW